MLILYIFRDIKSESSKKAWLMNHGIRSCESKYISSGSSRPKLNGGETARFNGGSTRTKN